MALPTKSEEELRLIEIEALTNLIKINNLLSLEVHEKAVKRLSVLLNYGMNKDEPYNPLLNIDFEKINKLNVKDNGCICDPSETWIEFNERGLCSKCGGHARV